MGHFPDPKSIVQPSQRSIVCYKNKFKGLLLKLSFKAGINEESCLNLDKLGQRV